MFLIIQDENYIKVRQSCLLENWPKVKKFKNLPHKFLTVNDHNINGIQGKENLWLEFQILQH